MNALRRWRCWVVGHDVRRIGSGHVLTLYRCDQCDRTFMSHRDHPRALLPMSQNEFARAIPWFEFDSTESETTR